MTQKMFSKLTSHAQYYTMRTRKRVRGVESVKFTLAHLKLYKNLKPGIVYIVYVNEDPIPLDSAGRPVYVFSHRGDTSGTKRTSPSGNILLSRVCICPGCGAYRSGKNMWNPFCYDCQVLNSSIKHCALDKEKRQQKLYDVEDIKKDNCDIRQQSRSSLFWEDKVLGCWNCANLHSPCKFNECFVDGIATQWVMRKWGKPLIFGRKIDAE